MKMLLVLPLLLVPALARADQCELVSDDMATHALAVLAEHPDVLSYCEPCNDQAPGEPHLLDHLAKQRGGAGGDNYAVTIDKREVDLAYTYVRTSPSRYENLAAIVGCVTSGVSPSLVVHDASDRGVMISASDEPVPPLAASPAAPPVTFVIQPEDHTWLIAAMVLGSSAIWAGTSLLILGRRRALAMRPRAIDLIVRS
jgi:hypothetical protein